MEVISRARFVKTAPDKLRLVGTMIKGKDFNWSMSQLINATLAAAKPLILVLKQAQARIKEKGDNLDNFKIKNILIDEGPKLKRRRILHQGRSTTILKRMSHITIVISDNGNQKPKIKEVNKKITPPIGAKNGSKS